MMVEFKELLHSKMVMIIVIVMLFSPIVIYTLINFCTKQKIEVEEHAINDIQDITLEESNAKINGKPSKIPV